MNEFLRITSKENDIIKQVSQLQKSSSKRKEESCFVLEGLRICMDAIINGFSVKRIIVSDSAYNKFAKEVKQIAEKSDYCIIVPDSLFSKISDTVSPQGILCVCGFKLQTGDELSSCGKYIALENLQDPSNLGAISRTAEAFGIDGIILSGGCDPYSSKSLRASMGALLRIPIFRTENMFELFDKFSLKSYSAVVHGDALNADEVCFENGSVIIIGNEANGLTEYTIEKSDVKVTIPMKGRAESLNASVAAAVLMWEMCKC